MVAPDRCAREYFFAALDADVETAVGQALAILSKLTAGVQEVVVPVSNVNGTVMPAEDLCISCGAEILQAPQMFQPSVLGRLRQGGANRSVDRCLPPGERNPASASLMRRNRQLRGNVDVSRCDAST